MREIKFRAWVGEMIPVNGLYISIDADLNQNYHIFRGGATLTKKGLVMVLSLFR